MRWVSPLSDRSDLKKRFDSAFDALMEREDIETFVTVLGHPRKERLLDEEIEAAVYGFILGSIKEILLNQARIEERREPDREETLEIMEEISQLLKNREEEIQRKVFDAVRRAEDKTYEEDARAMD
jgi:hypothetical protein